MTNSNPVLPTFNAGEISLIIAIMCQVQKDMKIDWHAASDLSTYQSNRSAYNAWRQIQNKLALSSAAKASSVDGTDVAAHSPNASPAKSQGLKTPSPTKKRKRVLRKIDSDNKRSKRESSFASPIPELDTEDRGAGINVKAEPDGEDDVV